jgi:DNA-binding response OmpR family regulator
MSKKSLIVDDDKDLAEFLVRRCRDLGLEVRAAHDALGALTAVESWRPDLICLDVTLPGGNGISVCEMLSTDERFAKVPVIILTGRTDEEIVRRCHALCAYYVTKCDDVWCRIEPLLEQLLGVSKSRQAAPIAPPKIERSRGDNRIVDLVFDMLGADPGLLREAKQAENSHPAAAIDLEPPWVLHIDDDEDLSRAVKLRLERHGIAVIRAFDGMQGYRSAFTHQADAIILDVNMPNGDGDYILRRLKENPVTDCIPVIVLTGDVSRTLERKMLNLGAESVLHKPLQFEELLALLRRYVTVASPVATEAYGAPAPEASASPVARC